MEEIPKGALMKCHKCNNTGKFREKLGVLVGPKSGTQQYGWKFGGLHYCFCNYGDLLRELDHRQELGMS